MIEILGHDGFLRLKIKRFEITTVNCENYISSKSIDIDGSVSQASAAPDQLLAKTIKCRWIVFMLPWKIYQDCGS